MDVASWYAVTQLTAANKASVGVTATVPTPPSLSEPSSSFIKPSLLVSPAKLR